MTGFKNWIRTTRLTGVGAVLLILFGGGLVLALLGPASVQAPALGGAVGLLLVLVGGGFAGGRMGASGKSLAEYRREFRPRDRDAEDHTVDPTVEAQAWERERDRYRERRSD